MGPLQCLRVDTLVSEADGAGNSSLCTHYLQQCRVAVTMQMVWIVPLLWFSDSLLNAMDYNTELSFFAAQYIRGALPGLFFQFQSASTCRFLQNRQYTLAPAIILPTCSAMHVIWCWLFVIKLGLGNLGLGYATSVTWTLECLLSWLYLCYVAGDLGASPWQLLGVSRRCFRGLKTYFGLALPATLQGCIET